MSAGRSPARRRPGAIVAVALLLLGFAAAMSTAPVRAAPASAVAPAALTLVDQDHVSIAPGGTVTFVVEVPGGVDLDALRGATVTTAEVSVVAYDPVDVPTPDRVGTHPRVADAIAGTLGGEVASATIPLASLTSSTKGRLSVPVVVVDDRAVAAAGAPGLILAEPGIYPVVIELRAGEEALARVTTFVKRDVAAGEPDVAPLAVALAVGTDAPVVLDADGNVAIDAATIGQLTTLVEILETSAMPATVHVAPQLLAGLRRVDAELAERFADVLDTSTILSAPVLPLDPSAAAAANQRDLYTQWLAEGEDLFGSADLPGTTLRAATTVTKPLSEPGGELLRDLGTRLLLLPPSLYDSLEGTLGGYTDTTQLVHVRVDDNRTFDAAIVDRAMGKRLARPSPTPFLDAVYATVDLLADRQDIIDRGDSPRRHTVLIGTDQLGLPDPATLAPITELISTTSGLSVSTVGQLSATTDTLLNDGDEVTVSLPAATAADIAPRIGLQTSLRASGAQAASMLLDTDPRPALWQRELDSLPSSAVSDERAAEIRDSLNAQYAAIRAAVQPPPAIDFTLTGRTGTIRLKFHNSADFPVQVVVRLGAASNKLIFPPEQAHVLAPNADTEVKIQIQSRANGAIPVYLTVLAPNDVAGTNPLAPVSRFTATVLALSGLGNLVTGAAMLVLITWWVRHIRISRRRRAATAALGRHPVSTAATLTTGRTSGGATATVPDP